jgi:hypothetical protein
MIGLIYSNSEETIRVDDLVLVDGRPGKVEGVFPKGSKASEDCGCEDTGALAIKFDDGSPVLMPFGNPVRITKQ